jgi:hypothetical protein
MSQLINRPADISNLGQPLNLGCKLDAERCLARVEAWFHQAVVDRVPVRFQHHNEEYEQRAGLEGTKWASLEERWFDVEYQIEAFERSLAGQVFHGETFPVFWPNLGPNAYSAFYAGRLDFAEVTSWYEPVIENLDDLSVLQADPFASVYFRKLDELTRAALDRCGDRYLVGYTDIHPSLDCAAAWRGISCLCLDLATDPGKVQPLLEKSVADFHRVFDHFDTLLKPHGQLSTTWMALPCRGRLHIPSCDVSAMISPAYFASFSLPLLKRELSGMTHCIYHVDGKGVAAHLDHILNLPEIQAIQWVQGLGKDAPIMQWVSLLKRIQAAGKSIAVDLQLAELEPFIAAIKPEGVLLCLGVEAGLQQSVLKRIAKW